MITYYPWSEAVLNECLTAHDIGELATLDLELTAKCSAASCIYCDSRPKVGSRHMNELNNSETEKLLKDAKKLGLRWIYVCGLGEPLEDYRFECLVELAWKLDVKLSIFTNGILINRKKAEWLHKRNVSIILKLDTFNEENFDKIIGKRGTALRIYNTIELLLDAGYGKKCRDNYTDFAFSIVPTTLNIRDIETVINFAINNDIYPSIGELEQAGRSSGKTYTDLALDNEQISLLKKKADALLCEGYYRPICPALITGVHIDNIGNYVVDKDTGLNCKWFLLKDPIGKELGNIRKNEMAIMFREARNYRRSCFSSNCSRIHQFESIDYIFGGCGGSPRKIIQLARQHL